MRVSELAGRLGELARLGYADCRVVVTDDGKSVLWTLGEEPPEPMQSDGTELHALDETPPASIDGVVVVLE